MSPMVKLLINFFLFVRHCAALWKWIRYSVTVPKSLHSIWTETDQKPSRCNVSLATAVNRMVSSSLAAPNWLSWVSSASVNRRHSSTTMGRDFTWNEWWVVYHLFIQLCETKRRTDAPTESRFNIYFHFALEPVRWFSLFIPFFSSSSSFGVVSARQTKICIRWHTLAVLQVFAGILWLYLGFGAAAQPVFSRMWHQSHREKIIYKI